MTRRFIGISLMLSGLFAGTAAIADEGVPWTAPAGVEKMSPCIPKMGEHFADPKTMPFGPWYNVYQGKLIAIEYAISVADFAAGKNFTNALTQFDGKPLTIDHVDVTLSPKGHPHFTEPHYDLHFYLVPDSVDSAITCK
jgi:hypothetical protein